MDFYYLKNNLLIGSLGLAVLTGMFRFQRLETGMKLFWLISCAGLIGETIAYYAAVKYRQNVGVYAVSSIVGIFMTCLYFNYSIPVFRKYHIGIFVGGISVLVGILCNFFLQSAGHFPAYFLHYQALIVMAMAIILLAEMLRQPNQLRIEREANFWACLILLFFWSLSYFHWTLFGHHANSTAWLKRFAIISMFLISFLTNIATAILFFMTPKLNGNG